MKQEKTVTTDEMLVRGDMLSVGTYISSTARVQSIEDDKDKAKKVVSAVIVASIAHGDKAQEFTTPIVLADGQTPENVVEAYNNGPKPFKRFQPVLMQVRSRAWSQRSGGWRMKGWLHPMPEHLAKAYSATL